MSFYEADELEALGLRQVGRGVKISRKASIYGAERIEIGDHSRVDDFCILSAGEGASFRIGAHVHVACHTTLIGRADITLETFANLSSRVSLYSSSDDFSGAAMTNPTVPAEFTNVISAPVVIGRHVVVGCGSVVLPGVTIAYGCAIGALSLVSQSTEPCGIYAGAPLRRLKDRARDFEDAEARLRAAALEGR
ncbi:MAG TPA: acyltransferase [Caulobacteraceae bacterium]|jgi:galactoside O-acetyltransferase|nr:acyltransferase [Caulobacteraceae bacterium]